MAGNFFASFETKHLVIGICCSVVGWGGSQIYTMGIQQAAMLAYQDDHSKQLVELSSLPPELAVVQKTLSIMIDTDIQLTEELKKQGEKIHEGETRITVLESKEEDNG